MFRCPLRPEDIGKRYGAPAYDPDTWVLRNGTHYCSFCNSLLPDEFMKRAREGHLVTGGDEYRAAVDDDTVRFEHFEYDQRVAFVDMINTREMNIAGGFFAVRPFFLIGNSAESNLIGESL